MRKTSGFTLIELLIVMAILTLLAGILFTVFAGAKGKARQTHCMNNLKQLGAAILLYRQDHDGGWPEFTFALYPEYVSTAAVLVCPDDGTSRKVRKERATVHGVYSSYDRCGGDALYIWSGRGLRMAADLRMDCESRAGRIAEWRLRNRLPLIRCQNHVFPGTDCDSREFIRLLTEEDVRGVIPSLALDGSVFLEVVPSPYGVNPFTLHVAARMTASEWEKLFEKCKQELACSEE